MTHRIDKTKGVMGQLPAHEIRRGWEMDLAQMRLCLGCGKYLHPKVWQERCAWSRPEYRIEQLGHIALGRLGK